MSNQSEQQCKKHVNMGSTYSPEKFDYESHRPGCFDAFKAPSLVDGVRIPYVGPRPMLVGDLADKRSHDR